MYSCLSPSIHSIFIYKKVIIIYTITTYSNRIYDNQNILSNLNIIRICDTIDRFNSCKFHAYNVALLKETDKDKYDDILNGSSFHMYIKQKFGLTDYYANTIVRLSEGLVQSQITNNKNYIKQYEEQIETIRGKLKECKNKLDDLKLFRESFIIVRNTLKTSDDKKHNIKLLKVLSKAYKNIKFTDTEVIVTNSFNKKVTTYGFYAFEYQYLNPKIVELKNRIGKYQYRINNLTNKINNCQQLKRCIFGSKKLMKKYSRNEINYKELYDAKYKSFEISGRSDAKYGNYVFKPTYNNETDSFDFTITLIDNSKLILNNIRFPYKQNELKQILAHNTTDKKMRPICFGIVRKKDLNNDYYFQIKVSFDIESVTPKLNYDKSSGIVAIDFNYGHLDMTELDVKGNLLNYKTIYYDLHFNSKQNELSLRKALDEICEYAKSKNKMLAVENINTYKSNFKANKDKRAQKLLNYTLHRLPYSRYLDIVNYLRIKYSLEVIKVKPQFTSIIGRLKYANQYKLQSHIAASYVIGRRALGFKEKPLKQHNKILVDDINKNEWTKWSKLNKYFNKQAKNQS